MQTTVQEAQCLREDTYWLLRLPRSPQWRQSWLLQLRRLAKEGMEQWRSRGMDPGHPAKDRQNILRARSASIRCFKSPIPAASREALSRSSPAHEAIGTRIRAARH